MWRLLHNPSAYPSAWMHTSFMVGSCFIYKLGMLPGQRFQAELSPSFLWKFTEFRAETPPHAFGIPNCVTPPRLRNSSPRNPLSLSEFQDATRGMVWIFSGITQWASSPLHNCAVVPSKGKQGLQCKVNGVQPVWGWQGKNSPGHPLYPCLP